MVLTERGKIRGGTIEFAQPLSLPEGLEVEVRIEPLAEVNLAVSTKREDLATLPFFGMWRDREDIPRYWQRCPRHGSKHSAPQSRPLALSEASLVW